MGNLIKMDLFINKKAIKVYLITFSFLCVLLALQSNKYFLNTISFGLAFCLVLTPLEAEKKNGFNFYIKSLPIKNKDYIYCKYLLALLYTIFSNLSMYLISIIISMILGNEIQLGLFNMSFDLIFNIFFWAIMLPILLLCNYKFFKVAYITIIAFSYGLYSFSLRGRLYILNKLNLNGTFTLKVLMVGFIVLLISLLVCNFIYKKREVH